jgi:hypothetical protein
VPISCPREAGAEAQQARGFARTAAIPMATSLSSWLSTVQIPPGLRTSPRRQIPTKKNDPLTFLHTALQNVANQHSPQKTSVRKTGWKYSCSQLFQLVGLSWISFVSWTFIMWQKHSQKTSVRKTGSFLLSALFQLDFHGQLFQLDFHHVAETLPKNISSKKGEFSALSTVSAGLS